jgi:hypothetical protein
MTVLGVAAAIASLGPVGRYSRRPRLTGILLSGAVYTLLPPPLISRALLVAAFALLAGWAAGAVRPHADDDRPVLIDLAAGAWASLLFVPENWMGFLGAIGGYLVLVEGAGVDRRIRLHLSAGTGFRRVGVAVGLGLLVGAVASLVLRLLR